MPPEALVWSPATIRLLILADRQRREARKELGFESRGLEVVIAPYDQIFNHQAAVLGVL